MNRKSFIQSLALLPLATSAMKLKELEKITDAFESTPKMPVLFLGHGSPLNAIQDNEFVRGWKTIGKALPEGSAEDPTG